ncbi:MAG: MFS transporter [Hyphomicrobium sp.]|nr:MFS transporter [Hyphomicrobium sp.]
MDASLTLSVDDRKRSLIAVILSCFGVGIAFGMGYPLAALTLEAWGETPLVIGIAGAAPNIAVLIVLPLLPRYLKGFSPVTIMVLGSAIAGVGYLLLYLVQNSWAWIAVRFLMGAGLALPWLLGETWINLVADERNRGRIVAIYSVAFFAGFAAGPVVLDITGIAGVLPFAVGIIGAVLTIIPILWARDVAPSVRHEAATGLFRSAMLAPAPIVGVFLGGFLETAHFSLIPNVGIAAGLDESRALALLTALLVGGFLLQHPLGWLGDVTSRPGLLVASGLSYILLALMVPWLLTLDHSLPVLINMGLCGGAIIGLYTLGLSTLGAEIRSEQLAAVNAAFIMSYTTGSVIGPAVAGAGMMFSPTWGFIGTTVSAALIVTTILALVLSPRLRQGR